MRIKIASDNTVTIYPIKNKWNREELVSLLHKAANFGYQNSTKDIGIMPELTDKWIEENF